MLTGGVGSQGLGLSSTVGLVCTGRAGAGLSSTGQSRAGLGWELHFLSLFDLVGWSLVHTSHSWKF